MMPFRQNWRRLRLLFIYVGDFFSFFTVTGRVFQKMQNELTSQNFLMFLSKQQAQEEQKNASIITNEKGFFQPVLNFLTTTFCTRLAIDVLSMGWGKLCERVLPSIEGFVYCLC